MDAAGELPPRSNLRDVLTTGADLVCFSGGKAIRGPQATGILCGRRDLVGPAALQMLDLDDHFDLWDPPPELIDKARLRGMPRHGIGRGMKVSRPFGQAGRYDVGVENPTEGHQATVLRVQVTV